MMFYKFSIISSLLFLTLFAKWTFGQNDKGPETNVVYGEKYIFTIETPYGWINDKDLAHKIGLVCLFYPEEEKVETNKNYFYANGIDKKTSEESLTNFINDDIEHFRKKYPDLTFKKIPVEISGGLRNGVVYSYSNLTDNYKVEVLYAETDDSFLIFSFASKTLEDYKTYQPVFDQFIASFIYRGNNPKPFLDYMKNQKK